MKSKIHQKKRNSALLYEFLIKHISNFLFENKKEEAVKTLNLTKFHFRDGTCLNQELKIFKNLLESKPKDKETALRLIEAACLSAAKINKAKLDESKSKIIKAINHDISNKVYEHRVSNYTVLASVQTLFNEQRLKNKTISDIEIQKLKEFVAAKMCETVENKIKFDPKYTNTVLKLVVNKFNEKYKNSLTENQKLFILEYINSQLKNENFKPKILAFSKFINKNLTEIKDKKILEDRNLMNKIKDSKEKFSKISLNEINDEVIQKYLGYIQLVDELKAE